MLLKLRKKNNMAKYRIKATYKKYIVERKGWLFWSNCFRQYTFEGCSYEKTFRIYSDAKEALEERLKHDAEIEDYKKKVASFKTCYYYPPLPEEEPLNA
jgi:hypothetical protein